jgi:phosphopantothenoylcysteine decarboxylase/phosphopantothenate--cysteine ligase
MGNLAGKHILLGVTGGIAAYKSVILLRELQQAGAEVKVVLTEDALRFVGIETFNALTRNETAVSIFSDGSSSDWTRHVHWSEWADLFVIAPCTANTLAKIAHGISDNLLTACVLASRSPLLLCPTMDGEMYIAPAVQANLRAVSSFGYHVLEPESGYLASGLSGKGRLPETETIVDRITSLVNAASGPGPLDGKKVVVTAGPTREFIDAVRFVSNPSTGKMGFAMAEAARDLGADVTLIHGPVSLKKPSGVTASPIVSAADLFEAVKAHHDADIIIMSAAVSDFTPETRVSHKIKKNEADTSVQFKPTQDILKWLGENRRQGQILIGFAMETDDILRNAHDKLVRKNVDWIIANNLNVEGAGFGYDTNHVFLLHRDGYTEIGGTKKEVAGSVLAHITGVSPRT